MSVVYLDTSAFVKTIVVEPESARLAAWLLERPHRASSALLRIEAVRAVRPHGRDVVEHARRGLGGLHLIRVGNSILDAAADLGAHARSLDAIHIATALALESDLDVLVTYDGRLAEAAAAAGVEVASP